MTIHKSKGTESPCVFIIGANNGFLPHANGEEEEERRLWYVAMTRAKDYLHITSIGGVTDGTRYIEVRPSQFLEESGIRLTPTENDTNVTDPGVDSESSSEV
jgi:superfamily I DNA/RNA helicase